jgi:hypothetical protein
MKKKIMISILVLVVIIIAVGIYVFIYTNHIESITERTGKYFDESGKEIGSCKIKGTLKRLADMPEYTTYYYSNNQQPTGYCKGDSISCFSSTQQQKQYQICTPMSLQTECDKSIHPIGGVKSKYRCVVDK